MPSVPLGRRNEACAATGERFRQAEPIVAVLVEPGPDEMPIRLDFGANAWERGARPEAGLTLAWWRTTAKVAGPTPETLLGPEDLLELVQRGETEPPDEPSGASDGETGVDNAGKRVVACVRHFLALELVRRRVLELVETDRDRLVVREVRTVKQREELGVAEPIEILSGGFGPDDLSRVAERLGPLVGLDEA
ncbi:MAG: hypothetical protein AAF108_02185 [Planctomycetota bacterium]